MNDIGIIILNYNNSVMTLDIIKNIINVEKRIKKTIIIVDNKSKKEERNLLIKSLNDYIVLNENDINTNNLPYNNQNFLLLLDENYGYAKGNNYGIRLSTYIGCKFSVISNNDIVFLEPVIELLVNDLKNNPKVGIVGPRVIGEDNKLALPRKRRSFYQELLATILLPLSRMLLKIFNLHVFCYETKEKYPYWIAGCFIVINNKIITDIGLYDENTFLFYEEAILAEKLLMKNYLTMYNDLVSIKHCSGKSTKELKNESISIYNITTKSYIYYLKNYLNYTEYQVRILLAIRKINNKLKSF